MARVPLIEESQHPELAESIAKIKGARGVRLINIYRLMLHSPALANAWFEFNQACAMEAILSREPPGSMTPVLVSKNIQYAETYWRFYCSKAGRDDLRRALRFFDPSTTSLDAIPVPAFVLVLRAEADGEVGPFPARSHLTLLTQVPEVGGGSTFSVLSAAPVTAESQ